MPPGAQLIEHLDGMGHAGGKGVIGVNQQQRLVREAVRVGAEGLQLTAKAHHPAVRVGPGDRDAEALPGQHV